MIQFYEARLDDIEVPRAWYTRNNAFLPHFHESIELLYVLEGESRAIIDGAHVSALPGDVVIAGSYQVHAYIRQQSYAIVAAIPLASARLLAGQLAVGRFASPLHSDREDGRLLQLLQLLASYAGCPEAQSGLSVAILAHLIDRVGLVQPDQAGTSGLPRQILGYLSEHYTERITSTQLAAHFGYSRSRFSHLFKATVGYSLPAYLHLVRLRRAASLLSGTALPVSEIAQQCGYTSMHTFHYAFRAQFGKTPGEYRRASPGGQAGREA